MCIRDRPGVSRAGITITAARFLKFNRYDSAKIAFLLSIPTLAAVSIYGLSNLIKSDSYNFSFLLKGRTATCTGDT